MEVPPPPPEKKEPLVTFTYDCYGCDQKIETDLTNTFYFIYTKQPWFDHTRSICDQGHCSLMFQDQFPDPDKFVEFASQFYYAKSDFADSDPDFIEARREGLGITDLEYKELTRTQERYVTNWGKFLGLIEVDITDF